jgi:hypothetical protein
MAKIGSWWLKSVAAEPAEEVVWSQAANRLKDSGRAVGGKLFLTDRRLIFCPHWVDAATGGKAWQVPLERVAAIETIPKGSPGGGMRDRLAIGLAGGGRERFVVNRLEAVVARLNTARGVAGGPPENSGEAHRR